MLWISRCRCVWDLPLGLAGKFSVHVWFCLSLFEVVIFATHNWKKTEKYSVKEHSWRQWALEFVGFLSFSPLTVNMKSTWKIFVFWCHSLNIQLRRHLLKKGTDLTIEAQYSHPIVPFIWKPGKPDLDQDFYFSKSHFSHLWLRYNFLPSQI